MPAPRFSEPLAWEDSPLNSPLANYDVDFATSLIWRWDSLIGFFRLVNIKAKYVRVDNLDSNQFLNVYFDNLRFPINAFQMLTLPIPEGSNTMRIEGDPTQLLECQVTFAAININQADTINYKAIQASGTEGVLWPIFYKAGPFNFGPTDDHTIQVFTIAGAIAVNLPDPTTVSNGWTIQVWNSSASTANITLAVTGGADIDGAASLNIPPNTKYWLALDGANAFTVVKATTNNPAVQYFTANGSWTPSQPTLTLDYVEVEVQAPGGGGGGAGVSAAATASCGSPGGAGGYSREKILAAALNLAGETVTVGGAAAGGAAGANPGITGTTTSFGAHVSATGGVGGVSNAAHGDNRSFNGALGGIGVGGDINTRGGPGQASIQSSAIGAPVAMNGCGGDAVLGGGARNVALVGGGAQTGNGVAADGFGGGGSGGLSYGGGAAASGGAGAPGIVIVHEFYK